ncbi:MAG: Maf family protein [Candidatus Uhrbacteria bacterium]|nr:Maf family protein [Candidatus Uhrbacteria bacterium]
MKIILGSQSASRKRTLEEHGIVFEVMSPNIDEKEIRDTDPQMLVLKIARAKADALLSKIFEPALLITSDQVVVCGGEFLEKPVSAEEARRFFELYTHNPPLTITAVVVTNTATGKRREGIDSSRVWFGLMPQAVIEQVIEDGSVFAWAGGYNIIGPLFIPYIEKVEGDPEGICGLPWKLTERLLDELS